MSNSRVNRRNYKLFINIYDLFYKYMALDGGDDWFYMAIFLR